MRKAFVTVVVLVLASSANGALSFVPGCSGAPWPSPDPVTDVCIVSDTDGGYACWIEILHLEVLECAGGPDFTAAGNPNGDSQINHYEEYPGWYEIIVASLNPSAPVVAGDHVVITLCGDSPPPPYEWRPCLNLYADDAETLLDTVYCFIPEPATFALLGLGGLVLLRRRV
ncbi:MAG: PEP-CTERM sorting domain-containing protein [Phycisphaerales bacterium]|nr:MAG: PEP-CTERM sorting domain-containing protein [Phycisphaerales bacterium]